MNILASLVLAVLANIPPAACTSSSKALVMTCLVSVSPDSQAQEPLRAGAKAATFSLCPGLRSEPGRRSVQNIMVSSTDELTKQKGT